jgi:hypothetical protein
VQDDLGLGALTASVICAFAVGPGFKGRRSPVPKGAFGHLYWHLVGEGAAMEEWLWKNNGRLCMSNLALGLFVGYIAGLGHGLFMARAVVAAVRKRLMDAKRR